LNKTVTELVASGGGGKSLLKLIIAAHLAVGKDFLGHKCYRPGKSICFDAEDDIAEQSRRLNAICVAFGFDIKIVRENVCLVSVDEILLQLTTPPPGLMINRDHIASLIQTIRESGVVMLALGPLAELHSGNENDNIAMRYVMGVLRLVAREGNIAVLVDHHTGKPPLAAADAWSGSQFAGRGASSIAGAARCVVTMFGATEKDCLEIGVPSTQRRQYVRIDTGKLNYGKPPSAQWLRWQEVRLWNGDEVGVLAPFDVKDNLNSTGQIFAEDLVRELRKAGSASMVLNKALDVLMRDPLIYKEGRVVAKNRLERILAQPVKTEDGSELRLLRGAKGIEGVAI
jgi:RecA-family ATPase